MTYGERIRRGREAKALTQEELAEALGVSRQAVSKWEGDLSRPAAGKLALLSETLDIPWDAWQAMDAEEAAAQAAARETEGERRARKWRRGSAALAALLCLSLLINVLLWAKLHPAEDGPAGETSPIAAFPETLTIRVSRDYRFGDETPEEDPKNPWQIPFLKDDLALQEHELLAAYFEDINALDVELFNKQMTALIAGEEVELPVYQFGNGRAEHGIPTKISPETPIIIEGIHALNDALSYSVPKYQKYKIYIAPQFQMNLDMHNPISYTDIRLLRRIVRDKKYRGASAERTLEMWHSVRRGEFKWIYPFQEGCNYVYNSALTYELCVLKKYALPALREVPSDSQYYITANRLIKFLKYFKDMDDKWVPCNSLLREFIGGSCFAEVDE